MKNNRNAYRLLSAVKEFMKQKKIKYQSLANELGVSLPTIKRWLNSTNLSIGELSRICEVLEISINDLVAYAENVTEQSFKFTHEQEKFLARYPSFLAYYYELAKGFLPVEIEKKHGISRASTNRYLKELCKIGLVKAHTLQSVKLSDKKTIIWDDSGPLGQVFSREMFRQLTERTLKNFGAKKDNAFLELWGRSLTKEDFIGLKDDIRKLGDKYRNLSNYNRKIYPKEMLSHVSCVLVVDEWDADVFSRIQEL